MIPKGQRAKDIRGRGIPDVRPGSRAHLSADRPFVVLMDGIPNPSPKFQYKVYLELLEARSNCRLLLDPRQCKACGIHVDEWRIGCHTCHHRHYCRSKTRGDIWIQHPTLKRIVQGSCAGCGCHFDDRTIGCGNCRARHTMRKTALNKRTM